MPRQKRIQSIQAGGESPRAHSCALVSSSSCRVLITGGLAEPAETQASGPSWGQVRLTREIIPIITAKLEPANKIKKFYTKW